MLIDWRMAAVVALNASFFTIPGAILLAGVEFALIRRVRSDLALDGTIIIVGGAAGGAILAAFIGVAAVGAGAFYGMTTATIYVLLQRQLKSRFEETV